MSAAFCAKLALGDDTGRDVGFAGQLPLKDSGGPGNIQLSSDFSLACPDTPLDANVACKGVGEGGGSGEAFHLGGA